MGCWQETCALTNTPIYEGERCVMLVLDEKEFNLYMKHFPLSPIGMRGTDNQWRMFKAVHKGTYNDYGWLNEVERPEDRAPCMFFHEAVWDWALTTAKANLDEHKFEADYMGLYNDLPESSLMKMSMLKVTDWLRDIAWVCHLAYWLRRNLLAAVSFQGHQEWEITEEQRREFLKLQLDVIDRHKAMFERWGAE